MRGTDENLAIFLAVVKIILQNLIIQKLFSYHRKKSSIIYHEKINLIAVIILLWLHDFYRLGSKHSLARASPARLYADKLAESQWYLAVCL